MLLVTARDARSSALSQRATEQLGVAKWARARLSLRGGLLQSMMMLFTFMGVAGLHVADFRCTASWHIICLYTFILYCPRCLVVMPQRKTELCVPQREAYLRAGLLQCLTLSYTGPTYMIPDSHRSLVQVSCAKARLYKAM